MCARGRLHACVLECVCRVCVNSCTCACVNSCMHELMQARRVCTPPKMKMTTFVHAKRGNRDGGPGMLTATGDYIHRRKAEGEEKSRWANKVNQLQKSV